MGVTDSAAPCVGCEEASFDTTVVVLGVIGEVVVLGIIGGVVGSTVSTGST